MANELTPIAASEWSAQKAAHLLARAGFGGTPEQVARLAAMSPADAVRSFIAVDQADNRHLAPFDHSGVHDPGLEPFPESRPAATDLAKQTGQSLGVKVKASGKSQVAELTPAERAAWKKALVPVHKEMEGRIGKDTIQSVYAETGFKPD